MAPRWWHTYPVRDLQNNVQIHFALRSNMQFNLVGFLGTPSPPLLLAYTQNAGRKHSYPVRDLQREAQIHFALHPNKEINQGSLRPYARCNDFLSHLCYNFGNGFGGRRL
jgi:hypothetical protein